MSEFKVYLENYFDNNEDAAKHFMECHRYSWLDVGKIPSECSGPCELMARHGGEGQGDEYYTVWKFTNGEESFNIKFEGNYQSHYGTDYVGFAFVNPVERMVTFWE